MNLVADRTSFAHSVGTQFVRYFECRYGLASSCDQKEQVWTELYPYHWSWTSTVLGCQMAQIWSAHRLHNSQWNLCICDLSYCENLCLHRLKTRYRHAKNTHRGIIDYFGHDIWNPDWYAYKQTGQTELRPDCIPFQLSIALQVEHTGIKRTLSTRNSSSPRFPWRTNKNHCGVTVGTWRLGSSSSSALSQTKFYDFLNQLTAMQLLLILLYRLRPICSRLS
jgi:hypothetical protein